MDAKEKKAMMSEIDDVKGVKWTLGLNSIVGSSIPESMIPDDVKSMLQGKDYRVDVCMLPSMQSATAAGQ